MHSLVLFVVHYESSQCTHYRPSALTGSEYKEKTASAESSSWRQQQALGAAYNYALISSIGTAQFRSAGSKKSTCNNDVPTSGKN